MREREEMQDRKSLIKCAFLWVEKVVITTLIKVTHIHTVLPQTGSDGQSTAAVFAVVLK